MTGDPHRLARANYLPRAFGFAAMFALVLLMWPEHDYPLWLVVAAGLHLLVVPQLFFLANLVRPSKLFEIRAMDSDAFMLGIWTGLFAYPLVFVFAVVAATTINNVMVGGLRQLGRGAGLFVVGALAAGMMTGFRIDPYSDAVATAFTAVALLAYLVGVGYVFHQQNGRLAKAKKQIEQKNAVFSALLDISLLIAEAETIDELLDRGLRQLRRLYPDVGFGILVRDTSRPQVIEYAAFEGLDTAAREWLLTQLARDVPNDARSVINGPEGAFRLLPMSGHLRTADGILAVSREEWEGHFRSTIALFLEQVGAAVENKLLTLKLESAARTDPLTGIANRGYLQSEMERLEELRQRYPGSHYAVIMVDVNGLKEVNDRFGHDAGDVLLRGVAGLLAECSRDSDLVARHGGDEFVILCRGTGLAGGRVVMERIRDSLKERPLDIEGCGTVRMSASMGVAGTDEAGDPDSETLLKWADDRMYRDKAAWYEAPESHGG